MRQIIRCGICLVALLATGFAQSTPTAGTATVTGVIKVGETPAANIALTLLPDRGAFNRPGAAQLQVLQGGSNFRTTTDASGQYRFTNIPAGRYRLEAQAEAFVGTRSESLTVTDGQTVTAPDLTLTRGGVITGKITGQNNRPLIAQRVTVSVVTEDGQTRPFNGGNRFGLETDDRGIYRAYGLPAGRYIVSAGENNASMGGRGGPPTPGGRMATRYALTYHPDVTEAAQATVIEISAGQTVEDVNIKLGEPLKRFVATGRIVNSETGQPIAGQTIMALQTAAGGRGPGGGAGGNATSDVNGEFTLSGLLPGSYVASLGRNFTGGSDYYGSGVQFQITDSNVSGLVLSVKPGASITGVVILEGVTDPTQKARLAQTMVMAVVRGNNTISGPGGRGSGGGGGGNTGRNAVAQVAPDGTFRLSGLAAGSVTLNLNSFGGGAGEVSLMRIESNGAQMPAEIQLAEGQQLTGLRLIAGIGNGAIRGQVVVQGALPAGVRLMVTARSLSGGQTQTTNLNQQGQFRFEGLLPGSYELRLQSGGGGRGGGGRGGNAQGNGNQAPSFTLPEVRQTVAVTNGTETPALLTVTIAQ